MVICSKGGKPTYRAIFANTSLDARTEKRSVITVAPLFSTNAFAPDAYLPHLIRFMDSVCEDPMLPSPNEPSGGTKRGHKKSQIEGRPWICIMETA